MNLFHKLVCEEDGQDLIEYVLLASGLSLAVTAGVTNVAGALNTEYGAVSTSVAALPS